MDIAADLGYSREMNQLEEGESISALASHRPRLPTDISCREIFTLPGVHMGCQFLRHDAHKCEKVSPPWLASVLLRATLGHWQLRQSDWCQQQGIHETHRRPRQDATS